MAKVREQTASRRARTAMQRLAILLVLASCGVCAANILNPSFEDTYYVAGHGNVPLGWRRVSHPSFNSYSTSDWSTDGLHSVCLLSRLTTATNVHTFDPGVHQAFSQVLDLTGIDVITFDAQLASGSGGLFEHFEAVLLVDNVPVWTRSSEGLYTGQRVNVSHLGGWRRVEVRLTALDSGAFDTSYMAYWDNFQLATGPEIIPATVVFDPNALNLASCRRWTTCYVTLPEAYDANDIVGSSVTVQGADPDAAAIPAYMGRQRWASAEGNEHNVADRDGDSLLERMIRFEHALLKEIVAEPDATLTVSGQLVDGSEFEGTATIRVIDLGRNRIRCQLLRKRLDQAAERLREMRSRWSEREKPVPPVCARVGKFRGRVRNACEKFREGREDREENGDRDDVKAMWAQLQEKLQIVHNRSRGNRGRGR